MNIQVGKYTGVCTGVQRAVDMIVKTASAQQQTPISTFGPLVRNQQVTNLLAIGKIEPLADIPEKGSGIVVIQPHGVRPSVKYRLQQAGFEVIDATCPNVAKTQEIIKSYSDRGYATIIVGDAKHPITEGLLGYTHGNAHVIGEVSDFDSLPEFEQAIIVSQATGNSLLFEQIRDRAARKYPHYLAFDTPCNEPADRCRNELTTDPRKPSHGTLSRQQEDDLLQGVSRSFALTIPQLPEGLRKRVTTAYLLCRIADTIEDEETLSAESKREFFDEFTGLLDDHDPSSIRGFVDRLLPRLSDNTLPAEKELILHADLVLGSFFSFTDKQREYLARCLRIMSAGMLRFQESKDAAGVPSLADMNDYCYHVAGVVGEMLTELFCDHSEKIAANRQALLKFAPSFGQGLQMTNILKDVWEDRERGACWLPRDIFDNAGFDLHDLGTSASLPEFGKGILDLVAITHGYLKNALEYTLCIPKEESGIRKFCLWAIGMAVLTLQNIHHLPRYTSSDQIKISRRDVKAVIVVTNMWIRNDFMLRQVFRAASRNLPAVDAEPGFERSMWNFVGGLSCPCEW